MMGKHRHGTVRFAGLSNRLRSHGTAVGVPGCSLAQVYAWTDESDLAFVTLRPLTKTPNGICYGDLRRNPFLDPLRKDPRFDKLLAELAPRD
jgi:hypothetical protein